jgi:3-methyladenine DNA glycosylase AlkC
MGSVIFFISTLSALYIPTVQKYTRPFSYRYRIPRDLLAAVEAVVDPKSLILTRYKKKESKFVLDLVQNNSKNFYQSVKVKNVSVVNTFNYYKIETSFNTFM